MSSVAFLGPQNATKSLVAGASPQTPLGELTELPRPPSTLRPLLLRRVEWRRAEGEKRQNDLYPRAPETLTPPLLVRGRAGALEHWFAGGHILKWRHWWRRYNGSRCESRLEPSHAWWKCNTKNKSLKFSITVLNYNKHTFHNSQFTLEHRTHLQLHR